MIAYASRRLKPSEKNYPVHKQEFLALKWAVTEKFSDYLLGSVFTAYTDNNPLTYVLRSAKLDAAGHRWFAELANYHFSICYRSGKKNLDADPLSHINWPGDSRSMRHLTWVMLFWGPSKLTFHFFPGSVVSFLLTPRCHCHSRFF